MGWENPPIPWHDFERRLSWRTDGDQRQMPLAKPVRLPTCPASPSPPEPVPWAELHCHSSFSFLDGCSAPERLVAEALELGIEALAVTDHDGMYGVAQFAQAAEQQATQHTELRTIFGAELSLDLAAPQNGVPDPEGRHLLVLARGPEGYRRLCRTISTAQLAGGRKGRPVYDTASFADVHGGEWAVLTGCRKGSVPAALAGDGPEAAERELRALVETFGRDNVYVELIDHDQPLDDGRNDTLAELAARVGVGVVASNNVHYAGPPQAALATAVASVRARRSLDEMVGWLPATGTAHLRSGAEMAARLARFPGVREATVELARACAFPFKKMTPKLPACPVPDGHDETSYLRHLTFEGAHHKYGTREQRPDAYTQIDHELDVIIAGGYPGYFLIVHAIVEFCRDNNILCQGRGSAANSAVCFALGITNVDAIKHRLLFERFLAPGRDGPPDIDLDIENARREEVIQDVYDRYGRKCAAQVANVISYRPKMALRDAGKALGFSLGQRDAWSKRVGFGDREPDESDVPAAVTSLARDFERLPRHLGIHSGGMVICDRPVGEVCPVEWAQMPDRSVLQWDKDDCAWLGLVKFDLLGLGMLSALRDAFQLIEDAHGDRLSLADIPDEDPAVYDMLCAADAIGVFQVESRAQLATLPRLRPRTFYDLVVEVAIIRPGPIQGGSVHPYLRRRHHPEEHTCPHPLMAPALERTYGVPLFQEQMMQIAVDCAGFSLAEADQLRQAMSSKRSEERIEALRQRLLDGMAEKGIDARLAEDIYHKLLGFAGFGFPESHAISFAHLVYASSYLKRYYPAAFTAALLRNQPMGFYSPNTLLGDARRHGVVVRGVDVNASEAKATLEPHDPEARPRGLDHPYASKNIPQPVIRMGLASVRNLGTEQAELIAAGRPYADMEDLARRTRLTVPALEALATAGAFGCFGLTRREALWAAGGLAGVRPGQLDGTTPGLPAPALPAMTPVEVTFADMWATGSSPTSHPVEHVRADLDARGVLPASALAGVRAGALVSAGGVVTHRQRPGTAGGVVFVSLEDETGIVNVICPPHSWQRYRRIAFDSAALIVHGCLERKDNVVNLLAHRFERLTITAPTRSRDFR
ncbi:MAG: DNA polymerase III subunit alpha [Streptosporangiales bacterium]|nr:DNA polymerase III subunit alpha [Streptosporangiales bacterium]